MKYLRKTLCLLLVSACSLGASAPARAADAMITVDAKTGFVLERVQADKKRQVGSLTKIATAMVVLDWSTKQGGDLAQVATIPPAALAEGGENNVGFQPGDTITLRDLLYAALVQSDNVAAYTLADHVGRALQAQLPPSGGAARGTSADYFVLQMNALAKHLGMERTRFLNPSGIDGKEKPYSTAADIARLTRYAMNSAGFRFYVSQKEREIEFGRGPDRMRYLLRNTNELLGRDAIDGVKTGRTALAGDCLVISAARPSEVVPQGATTLITPRRLIVVVLGSSDRFGEGAALLARGWSAYDQWAAAGRPIDKGQILGGPNE
ncbi:MAG: serine hydrolase [Verrucomicrobiota bacterium]|nr:D-alanyl-D-alanine carboxypeptidase [Chthoniobacterales bacterium]MDQ3545154.1 serine hydrolase [Verrucomicrobiota bacterium]